MGIPVLMEGQEARDGHPTFGGRYGSTRAKSGRLLSPRHSESMRNYCRGEFGDHYPRNSESKFLHAVISFF